MKRHGCVLLAGLALVGLGMGSAWSAPAGGKKTIVFVSGRASHGYGGHAHAAAGRLAARILNRNVPAVHVVVCEDGWPKDRALLDRADAIVLSCDGGVFVRQHGDDLEPLMEKGVGLACLHYTLDPAEPEACKRLIRWIGACYERHWSVNPHWEADFKTLPEHPVTRGAKPFRIRDEWYYHMRFVPDMKGATPILAAVPPDSTRMRPFGPHSGNPTVRARKGMPEIVGWVYERAGGGRGFGFTGMHTHWNWAQDSCRTVVLNALVWIAKAEVPLRGVPSRRPTLEELEADLRRPRPAKFKPEAVRKRIEEMNP